jgi:hypothetical protein
MENGMKLSVMNQFSVEKLDLLQLKTLIFQFQELKFTVVRKMKLRKMKKLLLTTSQLTLRSDLTTVV